MISLPHERQAVPAPSPSNIRVAVVPAAVIHCAVSRPESKLTADRI